MKLHKVTITGADDSINPESLVKLSTKYPYAEWGLLLSASSQGYCRFPSYKWLKSLNLLEAPLNLSGHFCGNLVRNLVNGKLPELDDSFPPWLWRMFQRIQINFHGVPHAPNKDFYTTLPQALKTSGKQYIFQADDVNEDLMWGMRQRSVNAVPLFDLSHGGGVLPENWPKPFPSVMCGYAGGLGPDNLKDQIEKISSLVGDHDIWIDMETNVRSDGDRLFDLKKVEECLQIAEPYVLK